MVEFLIKSDIQEITDRLATIANKFSGKTILLTGGRGFLGRYFTEVLVNLNKTVLDNPAKLILLDNLITAGNEGMIIPNFENVTFIEHNVVDPFEWEQPIDYVIHAAGIASPYYYRAYPLETLDVAISGTRRMLDLANDHNAHFTFFSSSEIYGDPDIKHVPMSESYRGNVSCQGPRACYDESKRVGETLCYIYHKYNNIKTNTIRPFNVFGPGMQKTDYRVLPNFALRIKRGLPLQIYGSGKQTRTFCYITDAIVGFFLVILNGVPGEAYNIGNPDQEISIIDLARKIENILAQPVNYDIVEHPDSYPNDEPNRRAPDIRKASVQLEFQALVQLDEGLKRFLSWSDTAYNDI